MLEQKWLTVPEAAKIVGCSVQRIRALASDDTLKAERIGERLWLIDKSSAEKLAKTPAKTGRPRGTTKK